MSEWAIRYERDLQGLLRRPTGEAGTVTIVCRKLRSGGSAAEYVLLEGERCSDETLVERLRPFDLKRLPIELGVVDISSEEMALADGTVCKITAHATSSLSVDKAPTQRGLRKVSFNEATTPARQQLIELARVAEGEGSLGDYIRDSFRGQLQSALGKIELSQLTHRRLQDQLQRDIKSAEDFLRPGANSEQNVLALANWYVKQVPTLAHPTPGDFDLTGMKHAAIRADEASDIVFHHPQVTSCDVPFYHDLANTLTASELMGVDRAMAGVGTLADISQRTAALFQQRKELAEKFIEILPELGRTAGLDISVADLGPLAEHALQLGHSFQSNPALGAETQVSAAISQATTIVLVRAYPAEGRLEVRREDLVEEEERERADGIVVLMHDGRIGGWKILGPLRRYDELVNEIDDWPTWMRHEDYQNLAGRWGVDDKPFELRLTQGG